jgi:hypothetical protein
LGYKFIFMVLQATAAFGLRWSCGVRSIGLKFIIESCHLSLFAADHAIRREQGFLSATPMLKLEMHVPGSDPRRVHCQRLSSVKA